MPAKPKKAAAPAAAPAASALSKDPVSVITCDMEGRIETFSDGAEQIFGYTRDEVVGKKRVSLFSPGDVVLGHVPAWLKAARTKGAHEGQTVFLRKDGTAFAAQVKITPTFKDGRQIGYCGVTHPMPEVDPQSVWPKTSFGVRLFKAVVIGRLPFLTATIVPMLLAAAWVHYAGAGTGAAFPWLEFALAMAGGIALHLAANVFNDYFDWKAGTDQANNDYFLPFSGGSRAVELGIATQRKMFTVATCALVAGLACGMTLAVLGKPLVLAFGAAGALIGFFYTAPPIRLAARHGLGELASFSAFGPLMTAGAVYAMSGQVTLEGFLIGLPVGLLTLAILWVNEFPDAPSDRATGKTTLVSDLSPRRARWVYPAIVAGAYLAAAALVLTNTLPAGSLLVLGGLPLAGLAGWIVVTKYADRSLAKGAATTIGNHLVSGLLMAAGLLWMS